MKIDPGNAALPSKGKDTSAQGMTYKERLLAYQQQNQPIATGKLEAWTHQQLDERQQFEAYAHKPPVRNHNPITQHRQDQERSLRMAAEQDLISEYEKQARNIIIYPEDPELEAAARTVLIEYVKSPRDLHPDHIQLNEKIPQQLKQIKVILESGKKALGTIRSVAKNFTYIKSDIDGAIRVVEKGIRVIKERAEKKNQV